MNKPYPDAKTKPNFKTGDYLRVINSDGASQIPNGMVFKAKDVYQDTDGDWFVILPEGSRENDDGYYAFRFELYQLSLTDQTISPIVNDMTCKTCLNERCSSSEKSCWKCGASL